MKTKNTPAFPVEVSMDENGNIRGSQTSNFSGFELGLSKREYFVAKAMQGLLSNPEWMKVYGKEKYLMKITICYKWKSLNTIIDSLMKFQQDPF